jgi:hypothetical protein
MARKKFFLIIDTETTQTGKVADLGLVVCDKQGKIERDYGILVAEYITDKVNHPLFHSFGDANDHFSKAGLPARYAKYSDMAADGRRLVATVPAINRLLTKIALQYRPVATAYNKAFDWEKCANTGIDLDPFDENFCLWHAAVEKWGNTRAYRDFCLENHYFGNRTKTGAMTLKTNADVMAKYLLGVGLPDEPHTALEDARDYERPILTALVKNTSPRDYMNPPAYDWKHHQVRNAYKPV